MAGIESVQLRLGKSELKRVAEECDILKKAAAYFAKESQCGMPLSWPVSMNSPRAICAA
jgi:hypothetical protein